MQFAPIRFYNVNGEVLPAGEARMHVSDLGLLRGYGVFDYFRVLNFTPLFIEDYLARFERSASCLHLSLPVSLSSLERQIHDLIQANGVPDAGVQLLLTGGYTPDGFTPAEPNLLILERPLKAPDPGLYNNGARLITFEYRRDIPAAKTTNYAVAISLLPRQRAADAVDVLYHRDGTVTETARSNVFVVRDGTVVTPKENILRGVTRKQVLELARKHYEVLETQVSLQDVLNAEEVFITSTLKGVMPIVSVEGKPIGDGKPGPVARHLSELFEAHVENYLSVAAS